MFIVKLRKFWYALSLILVVGSVFAFSIQGLQFGIDFTGGSLLALRFDERPSIVEIEQSLSDFELGSLVIQPVGESDMNIRMQSLNEETHQAVMNQLRNIYPTVDELRFDSIGPSIGAELQQKSWQALAIAFAAILAYIAYSFRKVSVGVQNWKYGVVTIIAALHDVIIPVGIFALLGSLYGFEVGTPFVVAILTVLGYSINDSIVVLDRVRENIHRMSASFEDVVASSLKQTFARSLNTSLTTLLTLIAVYLFGGDSLKPFALTLIIGIVAGTYSSIFIASPLLVSWNKLSRKR